MAVNFRARGISRGARKLARTLTLKKKKKRAQNLQLNPSKKAYTHALITTQTMFGLKVVFGT